MSKFKSGVWVGAAHWPNRMSHPDHWGKPFGGQVLDPYDSRAWANSPEFPEAHPHPGKVMDFVLKRQKEGLLLDVVPVLWDFKTHRVVRWERECCLHTFEEDMALWRASKAQQLYALSHPRAGLKHISEFLPEDLKERYAETVKVA